MESQPLISESQAVEALGGRAWIVTHGGVQQRRLESALGAPPPSGFSTLSGWSLADCLRNYPRPLATGPRCAVYVYGRMYDALIAGLDDPDLGAKLHGDGLHPRFHRIEDALAFDRDDPLGVAAQFEAFTGADVDYPVLCVRFDDLAANMAEICDFLAVPRRGWPYPEPNSLVEPLTAATRRRMADRYGALRKCMDAMPPVLEIGVGDGRSDTVAATARRAVAGTASTRAGSGAIPPGARVETCWSDLVHPARRLCDDRVRTLGADPATASVRVKQPAFVLDPGGDSWLFLNVRYDLGRAHCEALLCGWRICNSTLRPLDTGRLLDVADPLTMRDDGMLGPEDPRVVRCGDATLVSFNMPLADGSRRLFLYHVESDRTIPLELDLPRGLQHWEKNWMPFVVGDELRFVYRVEPLTIIRVVDWRNGRCEVLHDEDPLAAEFSRSGKAIHGGSNLVPWRREYQVGFVHPCNPWRPQLAVLDIEQQRFVHIGAMFDLPKPALPEAAEWRGKSVHFPATIHVDADRLLIGVEFEDRCPTLVSLPRTFIDDSLRAAGLGDLVKGVGREQAAPGT